MALVLRATTDKHHQKWGCDMKQLGRKGNAKGKMSTGAVVLMGLMAMGSLSCVKKNPPKRLGDQNCAVDGSTGLKLAKAPRTPKKVVKKYSAKKPISLMLSGSTNYTTDIAPIIQSKCISCHAAGSSSGDYSTYETVKTAYVSIYNQIETGAMPKGGSKLSDTEIAAFDSWYTGGLAETDTGSDSYSPSGTSTYVISYNSYIKPLLDDKQCFSCHASSTTKFTNYAEVSALGEKIYASMQSGSMPKDKPELKATEDELSYFKMWLDGGKAEADPSDAGSSADSGSEATGGESADASGANGGC
jgi:hypothetical protein